MHPALTRKIDISDSGAVIGYVEYPHMICTLQVMRVSMHKMLYGKEVVTRVQIHNLLIVYRIQLEVRNISAIVEQSFITVGRTLNLYFSSGECNFAQNGIQESYCDTHLVITY